MESLGDRMKRYEAAFDSTLPGRLPVVGGWVMVGINSDGFDHDVCLVRRDARRLRDWLTRWLESTGK